MYHFNSLPDYGTQLDPKDATCLGRDAAEQVRSVLNLRENSDPTPLVALPGLAAQVGLGTLHLKDEGQRLGLGSFKALGGAYALMRLVQAEATARIGRHVPAEDLLNGDVAEIAAGMTFACATDGNHGRSVAQGAQLVGARAVIFVHSGVSQCRIDAIAQFGAEIIRVDGNYDDSVAEASRVSDSRGWTVLSDTSWQGYEEIPALVMQGYTALVSEALNQLPEPPSHVFLQAGVGGFAAAVAGHLAICLPDSRPHVTIVDPARAACLLASAKAGRAIKVKETEPTVMAMLECYEPSLVAFRILARIADGFMTVDEEDALHAMRRLADPLDQDDPVVAGESGAVGLAGVLRVLEDGQLADRIGLGPQSHVLVINTEGATDAALYEHIVGRSPADVAGRHPAGA